MSGHTAAAGSIVVGVDGSERGLVGVQWAAREAQRTGAPLSVVSVVPTFSPSGPLLMIPESDLRGYGSRVVHESVAAARQEAPEIQVIGGVVSGHRVSELVHVSRQASLLVLASRRLSLAEHVWTGATVTGVVSRATCPVLVVPPTWEPSDHDGSGDVVVGFKQPRHADELLAGAFAVAADLATGLRVLHTWRLDSAYDDMIAGHHDEEAEWTREERGVIERQLRDVRESYPEVPVTVQVIHDRPTKALVEASAGAQRLVIGKPAHGGAVHHLGRTARGVLRGSACPVEVLPVSRAPVYSGLDVERSGHLVRE
jgi:nucleotide-binding universal stress UspA family protein